MKTVLLDAERAAELEVHGRVKSAVLVPVYLDAACSSPAASR